MISAVLLTTSFREDRLANINSDETRGQEEGWYIGPQVAQGRNCCVTFETV